MANARQIKQRIGSAQNISKITKAMEMVSASKMKRAQDQALAARPYAYALNSALNKLADSLEPGSLLHPLLNEHEAGIPILVVITTDRGLCGSLNQNLFKEVYNWQKNHQNGQLVIIGKKGVNLSRFSGIPVYAQFTDTPDTISSSDVVAITQLVMNKFLSEEFKSVHILFMDFINTLSQKVKLNQLLPLKPFRDSSVESLVQAQKAEYTFEPSPAVILNDLLPYYIENFVYQSFLESKASEHSARMVAMKNASENARDLVKELRMVYNKSRQASITSELLDITTATLSLE